MSPGRDYRSRIESWLHLAADKRPERVALESAGRTLSYSQLAELAARGVRSLQLRGVRAGDRVGLAVEDPIEFVVALHACLLLGAPAVPIDLRLSEAERGARARNTTAVLRELDRSGAPVWGVPSPPDDAVATVMHTSGTTAAPKPVELSYGNWLASALGSAAALGLDQEERWLCPMPLTHVGGLSIPIRSAIYATTAVLCGRFETEAVLGELMDASRRITLVSLVSTMLARLLDAGLERPPALRWALLGGGPIPPPLLDRAREAGVPVAPTYGMTEACSQIATFGRALPGIELRIFEREVLVRGAVVSRQARSEGGWLHTGDLGALDEEGKLVITGRKSETIVSGGENVSPTEVEEVLLEHPDVVDAGVFGRPDPEWGEAVTAIVVPRDGAAVDPAELRAFCAARLAKFKVPKAIGFTQQLPRTAAGKLRRRQLDGFV